MMTCIGRPDLVQEPGPVELYVDLDEAQVADQLYSLTLLVALVAAGVGVVGALGLLWRRRSVLRRRSGAVARICGLAALTFGLLSLAVHLAFGHRPGTAEALGPVAFFEAHPAFLVVFAAGVVAVVAGR